MLTGVAEGVPRGLEGEGDMEVDQEGEVKFEKRRERERKRSSEKKKSIKVRDKEWILKKKEASPSTINTTALVYLYI